jgi:hypothetical protein
VEKKDEKKAVENIKSFMHLDSIIYFDSRNWSLWLNGTRISSDANKVGSELFVKAISPNKVLVLWTMSMSKWKILSGKSETDAPKVNEDNQVEIEFSLKSNQTYMLTTNQVIEGKVNPDSNRGGLGASLKKIIPSISSPSSNQKSDDAIKTNSSWADIKK